MMRQFKVSSSITPRDSQAIARYLSDISQIEVDHSREVELAQKIKAGGREGEQARNELVKANLRFVISVAKQYQRQGLELADLISEGNAGLLKAADNFDDTRGFKFISYAVWWIRQSILQAVSQQGRLVRLPLNQFNAMNLMRREKAAFVQEFGCKPSVEELATITGLTEEHIKMLQKADKFHTSLDAPVAGDDDSEMTLLDKMTSNAEDPDHQLEAESLHKDLSSIVGQVLNDREKHILFMSFGIGGQREMSLDEVAEQLDLSRERVRQIREKSLKKILNSKESCFLRKYLS